MFSGREGFAASDQARREVDDEGRGRAVGWNMPFKGRGQKIDTASSGSVCGRQTKMRQKAIVGRFKGSKAVQKIEARDPAIAGVLQRVRQHSGEGYGCDLAGHGLMDLEIPGIARKDELTSQRQKPAQIAQSSRLLDHTSLHRLTPSPVHTLCATIVGYSPLSSRIA